MSRNNQVDNIEYENCEGNLVVFFYDMTVLGLIDRIDEDGTVAIVCKNIAKDLLSKFKNFVFWD